MQQKEDDRIYRLGKDLVGKKKNKLVATEDLRYIVPFKKNC